MLIGLKQGTKSICHALLVLVVFASCCCAFFSDRSLTSALQNRLSLAISLIEVPKPASIAIQITYAGRAPKALLVGATDNTNARWNISAILADKAGTERTLGERTSVGIGNLQPFKILLRAREPYRATLTLSDLRFMDARGERFVLADHIGLGERLKLIIHCGRGFPNVEPSWKGDLVSEWLHL